MKDKIAKKLRIKKEPAPKLGDRVTNDTVSAHREEILKGARKYIYPLQHTKHRLVVISISIFTLAVVAFFGYSVYALYKDKTTNDFMYKVTKVVPFPLARIGSEFVSYENYLFEIKHYMFYYSTQQELDFNSDAGKAQLAEFKKRALDKVITDAYIKQIAKQRGITVSEADVDEAINVARGQYRLSGNDSELEAILKDYWGWSINDFRRSLKTQLLSQKVLSALDTDTHDRAQAALKALDGGKDFAELAKEVSEDLATKDNGGEFGMLIEQSNRDVPPRTVDALFKLQPGQYSGVIDNGANGLEIVKNIENKGNQIRGAHIAFNFKDVNEFINNEKASKPARVYLNL